MSAKAVGWVREQHTGSPVDKAVLFVLAAESDPSGACSLSIRDIARDSNADVVTVYRALDRLRGRGLLEWETGSGRAPNSYRLAVPATRRRRRSKPP